MTQPSPELVDLAVAYGVATEYWDWQGQHVTVSAEVVTKVLKALGVDAANPGQALAEQHDGRWRRTLPRTLVMRKGWTPWFAVHLPHGSRAEVWVELEDGGQRRDIAQQNHWVDPRVIDGAEIGEATYQLPADLPLGYHRLRARTVAETAECSLIVTPQRLDPPKQRSWGWVLQLYSVRSALSWGAGDLHDLGELAAWSALEHGAGFVLVNPLHAAETAGPMEPSPYLPASRRFANPLYLRVEDIAEYTDLTDESRRDIRKLAEQARWDGETLDRDRVWTAKRQALHVLSEVPLSIGRAAEYAAYKRREGPGLVDFATWAAIADAHGPNWREWPVDLTDPQSAAVVAFRNDNVDLVEFHCWLQWQLDSQLAGVQARAEAAGMPVGVVHDLAVGVHPNGADAWALQRVLAEDIHAGAPPDAFNQQGQDWSQPPWRPDTLAESGYAAWRDLVRSVVRHAGGLRIDHIIGLFRLWWVTGSGGTYVRYDHEALVGILVLEAARAGVTVIGEDLGTVEPWVREYLTERGILGTSVLWFERSADGKPLPPERWRELCLATVATHDLPPTAGYLAGDHVRLRNELGLLTRSLEEELAVDEAERADWLAVLRERSLLAPDEADTERVIEALHRYVAHTSSLLVGVALTDAVGERRTQNQPGTKNEYPNWRIPLRGPDGVAVLLDDLPSNPRLRRLTAILSGHGAATSSNRHRREADSVTR